MLPDIMATAATGPVCGWIFHTALHFSPRSREELQHGPSVCVSLSAQLTNTFYTYLVALLFDRFNAYFITLKVLNRRVYAEIGLLM